MKQKWCVYVVSVICALAGLSGTADCKTLYVSAATGNDWNNSGLSWDKARATIGSALSSAASGDEVWVARGTYGERITINSGIAVYGGFAGTEQTREQRNPKLNQTVIGDKPGGTVVRFGSSPAPSTIIDGFTIRGATSGGDTGGGIYCPGGSPTISNNLITGNSANRGGGICYSGTGNPKITGNTIRSNRASNGGGVFLSSSTSSKPVIKNCVISGNVSETSAGVHLSGPCELTNNTFVGNAGWVIYGITFKADVRIQNNILAFNTSGIRCFTSMSPVVSNNCVYNPDGVDYSGIAPGVGDINLDPKLVGWQFGDCHIQPDSPCRDAGLTEAVGTGDKDMDGQERVLPAGGAVDIGADESDGTTWNVSIPVVRVRPDGSDANDGSSWELAKRTVQAGIDAAAVQAGEVWVSQGTYFERIKLNAGAYVYGGFAGTEQTRDERDWKANETIIDGSAGGSVVSATNVGFGMAAIDGFTVRNGQATQGGGFYCYYASPLITNSQICSNVAQPVDTYSGGEGGGIYCEYSQPLISRNTIAGNSGARGGGIGLLKSSPIVRGNRITGNSGIGCAVYGDGSAPLVVNNVIAQNRDSSGAYGCIHCVNSSLPAVINNTIVDNRGCLGVRVASQLGAKICNNIVAFNNGGIDCSGATADKFDIRNNCLFYGGVFPSASAIGNIKADPQLAGWRLGDYHIQPNSPCRDAGLNEVVGPYDVDMDGEPRIAPAGGRVDIGADECDGVRRVVDGLVIRVSPDGDDANDGSSWMLAKRTVQAGLNAAMRVCGEVWVKAGTYDECIKPADRLAGEPAELECAYLYGGFSGSEECMDERNPKVNKSILDGGRKGTVVTTVNGSRVVIALDGFTVRNGYAQYGGGIVCNSPTLITNNTIIGNTAYWRGGGLSAYPNGAIYGDLTVVNNVIAGNAALHASGGGGGLDIAGTDVVVTGNAIARNTAPNGAGIYCAPGSNQISTITISGNSIVNNYGDGVKMVDGSFYVVPVVITNNSIVENAGAGIRTAYDYSFRLSNNLFAHNSTGLDDTYAENYDSAMILRNNCFYNPGGRETVKSVLGPDNLTLDPKLAEGWWCGDFRAHIQPDSPCRDAGWNQAAGVPSQDIDGQARVLPAGGTIDIGADESDGTSWTWEPESVVIRVSPNGDDLNDGLSWEAAKKTVQAGIEAAALTGGDVWVAAGHYAEMSTLRKGVYLYGGFAGNEKTLDERPAFPRSDPDPHATVLDGTKNGSVVRLVMLDKYCGVDGFTITNGTGTIYNNGENPDFPTSTRSGGGILCDRSSPVISNNTITGNTSSFGGGIYLKNSNARVIGNTIKANEVTNFAYGGGIYAFGGSPVVSRNSISGNISSRFAGVCLWSCKEAVVSENLISANRAHSVGGGIAAMTSTATISGNTVVDNVSKGGGAGLALWLGGKISAAGNLICNNQTTSDGGGVWIDGSLWDTPSPVEVDLIGNTIAGNTATNGGGIATLNAAALLAANNVVAFNSSGVYTKDGAAIIKNNAFFNLDADNWMTSGQRSDNLRADPLFVDTAKRDYHLKPASPCINAGWNDAPGMAERDMDGQKRVCGGTVDIGADEWWQSVGDAKRAIGPVEMSGAVVTAAFPDFFYIESDDRIAGLRVQKSSHGLEVGQRADVAGSVGTNSDGEAFVDASEVGSFGSGSLQPWIVTNRGLGGARSGNQEAVWSWITLKEPGGGFKRFWMPVPGANTTGLLVRVWGRVTDVEDRFFYIDDGSALDDDTGSRGIRVYGSVAPDAVGKMVTVTGVASCKRVENDPVRVILTRGEGDVVFR